MAERALQWDGCFNVRDLGGHPTEDGRTTRFRAVVRADSRSRLSEAGWQALAAYGVTRVLDLRRDDERAADPPDRLDIDVVRISLTGAIEDPAAWEAVKRAAAGARDLVERYAVLYAAALDQCRPALGAAVDAVATAPRGPVVVHCTAGKDRTGLVVALLLRLCRVPIEDVDADYAESERAVRLARAAWIDAASEGDERARRLATTETPAGAMARVLAELERRHGTVDAYLGVCGVCAASRALARARLLA